MQGVVRIIGGKWRRRRLHFPALLELRPTPDRVRETLFNWLQPVLPGAHCLDLFSGSGALGLEAASRGAAHVTLLDRQRELSDYLEAEAQKLGADQVEVVCADALHWLEQPAQTFDIVFVDPPYDAHILEITCARLATGGWLNPGALIYMEIPRREELPPLPSDWQLQRHKRAGNLRYYLAQQLLPPAEDTAHG